MDNRRGTDHQFRLRKGRSSIDAISRVAASAIYAISGSLFTSHMCAIIVLDVGMPFTGLDGKKLSLP